MGLVTRPRLYSQSKGVTSVRSRVANLKDLEPKINHEALTDAIVDVFSEEFGGSTNVKV